MTLEAVFAGDERWHVALADCRFALSCMASSTVDLFTMDPPYGIGFMGREWDSFTPSETEARKQRKRRKATKVPEGQHGLPGELGAASVEYDTSPSGNQRFQAWVTEWAREALRVAKPGAHLVAFGGTRTWHRLVAGIEDAGWEIRDSLCWLYGSGFPKSLNVAKAIEALELTGGSSPKHLADAVDATGHGVAAVDGHGLKWDEDDGSKQGVPRHAPGNWEPTTEAAKAWDGYGTALKPGHEPIVLARKPLAGTVAANVLKHGTGALNIDGCRIATDWNEPDRPESWKRSGHSAKPDAEKIAAPPGDGIELNAKGRFPANVLLSHHDECELVGQRAVERRLIDARGKTTPSQFGAMGGSVAIGTTVEAQDVWACHPDCPVRLLDEQSGRSASSDHTRHTAARDNVAKGAEGHRVTVGVADSGGASRFFYSSKADRTERNAGLDGEKNDHPTVKKVAVLRWLVRLASRPGALIVDPFVGSGSTGVAVMLEGEGRRFVGIDREPGYVNFARARIAHVVGGAWERESVPPPADKPEPLPPPPKAQAGLFDALGGAL